MQKQREIEETNVVIRSNETDILLELFGKKSGIFHSLLYLDLHEFRRSTNSKRKITYKFVPP